MVTQNRQAVRVQDPLKLAHHLEQLGGTASLVELIQIKQHDIDQLSQQCKGLADETLRCTQLSNLTMYICLVVLSKLLGPEHVPCQTSQAAFVEVLWRVCWNVYTVHACHYGFPTSMCSYNVKVNNPAGVTG